MKLLMRHFLVMLVALFGVEQLGAQSFTVDNTMRIDGTGGLLVGFQQINTVKYSRLVEGTPFFPDDYQSGSLLLPNGQKLNVPAMKLNLLDNEIYFRDDKGTEMVLTLAVKSITIQQPAKVPAEFDYLRQEAGNSDIQGWVQVLHRSDGFMLYKRHMKQMQELRPYGSATTEQHIRTNYQYYASVNGNWQRVKKLEELAALHPNKAAELQAFIKKEKLSSKSDEDWEKLAAIW